MTARELISNLRRCGPQSLTVIFHYVADRAHELRLADGQKLNDCLDFAAMLRELGEAARLTRPELLDSPPQLRTVSTLDPTCPRCGHVHEGDKECGAEIARGRICRCEMEVPA